MQLIQLSGKFVSESKFRENPSAFIPHIQKPNRAALEALITKPEVERRLLLRLRKKAAIYAQDFTSDGEQNGSSKIDVDGVVDLYESYIIPLTKEVEVSTALSVQVGIQRSCNRWIIYYADLTDYHKRTSKN
jgi:chorismate mutase